MTASNCQIERCSLPSSIDIPLTTCCTTRTVATSECLAKALVAYTIRFVVVWLSKDVEKANRKTLRHVRELSEG